MCSVRFHRTATVSLNSVMLNCSHDTAMSYTNQSAQQHMKFNAPRQCNLIVIESKSDIAEKERALQDKQIGSEQLRYNV